MANETPDPTQVPVTPPAPPVDWTASIQNPDVKSWLANKKYESPEVLANSAYSMERLYGAEKAGRTVVMPSDQVDAQGNVVKRDEEGWKAFNAKLGVPEKPEDYKLPVPQGMDDGFSKTASQWMLKAGIPAKAAQALVGEWNQWIAEQVKTGEAADKAKSEALLTTLKGEWGSAFEQKAELARRGLAAVAKDSGLDDKDIRTLETSLGTDKMLRMFARIGEAGKEGSFAGGEGGAFKMTPDQADAAANDIIAKRAAGTINDYEWRTTYEKEVLRLGELASMRAS